MQTFDVIVLGTGGVGSAALYHLAARGARCLGIDAHPPAHDRGSSHGENRIIRQAYYEHPNYVPLALAAYDHWSELEAAAEQQLLFRTGLLQVGETEGGVLKGVLTSAATHGLAVERLTAEEIPRRFPGFLAPAGMDGVFEAAAGYLAVEQCVAQHLKQAMASGAQLRSSEKVISWKADATGVTVATDQGKYAADQLIVAAGAWSSSMLAELGIPLRVLRKPQFWFPVANGDLRRSDSPAFLFDMPQGIFYGFPPCGGRVKVAEHTGGNLVPNPDQVDRSLQLQDLDRVARFTSAWLPGLETQPVDHSVCMYTMSPDAHFVLDRHPMYPQVCFAAGMSGHGFKFTGILGKVLADWALRGRTDLPVDFLGLARLATGLR